MAARLAAPAQSAGISDGTSESTSSTVRELIVIPELPNSIHLQHAIQQVSSTVVEVNGDSSGQSSPNAEAQHTFITVAMQGAWSNSAQDVKVEDTSDPESEGGNGVNYHVQYVTEPQEIYTQGHQNMEGLRTYPVYGVATVSGAGGEAAAGWAAGEAGDYTAYPVVVAGDEAASPPPATPAAAAPRMPPATVQWLLDNYETAEGVSLPRSTLYAHYLRHCAHHRLDPVNAASFGKLIRSVFVGLRTRRLGTRGNSKYHYYGIRAKPSAAGVAAPPEPAEPGDGDSPGPQAARAPAAAHRAYLGCTAPPSPPALRADEPGDAEAAAALVRAHRAHGAALLAAAAALDTPAVRAAQGWWRAAGPAAARLLATPQGARWLRRASATLYQRALDALLPDVLRPIPPQLTQAIRNFAKGVEAAVWGGCNEAEAPAAARRAQAAAAGALAAALRRYTSLNHLAQAARAVLTNHHQIHQMVSDLNRVDFRVVREQAAWAMACGGGGAARRLEADFKATLGRGASLEQWAAWLERAVRRALARHSRLSPARFVARARRLLLDWSFYSSLVIRELTLRSAASFGSFHLIRLLYDEYVSYLIERRVAEHLDLPPIAVMHRLTEEDNENGDDNGERGDGDDDDHDHDHDHDHNHEQVDDHDQVEEHDHVDDNDNDQDWDWEDDDDDEDEPDVKKMKSDSE